MRKENLEPILASQKLDDQWRSWIPKYQWNFLPCNLEWDNIWKDLNNKQIKVKSREDIMR
jgi:hypothetical protein